MSDLPKRLVDRHNSMYGLGSCPSVLTEAAERIRELEEEAQVRTNWAERNYDLAAQVEMLTTCLPHRLDKAFYLGQTYWQQADSDFTSYHKKSDVTLQTFKKLKELTPLPDLATPILAERDAKTLEEAAEVCGDRCISVSVELRRMAQELRNK